MIDRRDTKRHADIGKTIVQQMQERHRIAPTRDRDAHTRRQGRSELLPHDGMDIAPSPAQLQASFARSASAAATASEAGNRPPTSDRVTQA